MLILVAKVVEILLRRLPVYQIVGNHSGAKNVNNCTARTTGKTINGTTTRPKSTTFHRPIGCHASSYLGHNSTTSLLSLAEPSMVTSSLDCYDEDDIDGT